MAVTRMILAVQLTDPKPTRLRVRGPVGTPAPAMTCRRRGAATSLPVGCVDGAWTVDLEAGDYLIELRAEAWLAGRIDVTAELAPGQRLPTFVTQGPPPHDPRGGLAAWEATALYVDPPESSATADPKDPWPPPPPPPAMVTLAPVSSDWFTTELGAARTRISPQLAGTSALESTTGKPLPAAVLEDLITGP